MRNITGVINTVYSCPKTLSEIMKGVQGLFGNVRANSRKWLQMGIVISHILSMYVVEYRRNKDYPVTFHSGFAVPIKCFRVIIGLPHPNVKLAMHT